MSEITEPSMRKFLHDFIHEPSRAIYYTRSRFITIYLRRPGDAWDGNDKRYYYANLGDPSNWEVSTVTEAVRKLIDLIIKEWGVKPFEIMSNNVTCKALPWPI